MYVSNTGWQNQVKRPLTAYPKVPRGKCWHEPEGRVRIQKMSGLLFPYWPFEKTDAGRDWGQEEKGTTEDEMTEWHHRLDGHEFG